MGFFIFLWYNCTRRSNYELYSIDNSVKNNTKILVKDLNEHNINKEFTTNTSFYNYEVKGLAKEESEITSRITPEENKNVVINNNLEFTYSWNTAFDHNNIKDAEFFTLNDEVHAVEMMYSIETTFLENSKAKGFKYDFKDGKYSYVGILPKTSGDFKLSELNLDSLLLSKKTDKVIYVSCNPITLARDIKLMDEYDVEKITPVDMFPNTEHVECVCLLHRKKS